ncbi:MAG: YifB family Mg chelatase-like AAA ATPase [Oleiphilaceae bacterium]|nr:YifB family Mg chelatase-like AAA ATPase [Oleiphilaceae bacterium]
MSLSTITTRAQFGVQAPEVRVETHISNGLPALSIVGLPETAVRESKERVRSALINSGFEFPHRRVTINLAPADLPKQGGRYDLAIAMGILVATQQVATEAVGHLEFIAELGLGGELRTVTGALPAAMAAAKAQRGLVVALENAMEASWSDAKPVFGARNLVELCQHLREGGILQTVARPAPSFGAHHAPDLNEVMGQFRPRRALELAAAGQHNLLFYGPPGTGKSMLASRLPGILPPLSREQALEVASLYSLVGESRLSQSFLKRPFRSPHHSASSPSLVGGGSMPRPGEISLAHHGVLFMDELPEFGRHVLQVLREPLESGEIHIARAQASLRFPAQFQLVAAMNPCPCGYAGHPAITCECSPQQILQYRNKLSGPLLDRFDLQVEVGVPPARALLDDLEAESSAQVAERVLRARDIQLARQGKTNHALGSKELKHVCHLDRSLQTHLEQSMERLAISARGIHRVLRVARTLADLEASECLTKRHIMEALAFRSLSRRPQ